MSVMAVAGIAVFAAVAFAALGPLSMAVSSGGITPSFYPGNFVAEDDGNGVCFALENGGYIGSVTSDMVGIKVDPPANFSNSHLSVQISADGKFLSWTLTDATMVAVIVKGGNGFNLYDYTGSNLSSDSGLSSPPKNGKYPAISHYNICYVPDLRPDGDQGCTPGYWRNHGDRWEGAAPGDDFDTTFGVDAFSPNITLGTAIQLGGGGINALARHATAALLNAYGGVPNGDGTTVAYPYSVHDVVEMVQAAVADGTIEETKDLFAAANEAGCPLSGTPANPV